MIELGNLFLKNLLPTFLIAGVGFLLGKWLHIQPRSLSQIIFYVFSPCLVFNLLVSNQLSQGDVVRTMGFAAVTMLLIGAMALGIGLALRLERRLFAAVLLTSMFMNAGNLGIPINLFAFGEAAQTHASLYFVTSSILINSIGIIIASLGTSSIKQALVNLLKIPAIYAVTLAFGLGAFGWSLPVPIARATRLLGDAAVPSMLILLGLQLHLVRWTGQTMALTLASTLRLLVAPLLAIVLAPVFGLQGAARQAGILESGMPTAVMITVLATEFDIEPSFVTMTVFTTTLICPFILTPLMAYLGG